MNKTEEILRRLVKTNSTNPPGNEMDVVKEILSFFPENIDYEIVEHGGNRASLVIKIAGKSSEAIGFVGHIDTVPVPDASNWEYPPFDAVIEDGYMYGRGASDMKGGVTAMILTALYFIENGITPYNTLKFCFTADEESYGTGISTIVERGIIKDVVRIFVPEPSDEKIGICEKGALWFEVYVKGKASHASKPHLGVNAIENLIIFEERLKRTIDLGKEHSLLGTSTFSLTSIEGGVKTNVVPDEAKATIDIRTVPGIDHKKIIDDAKSIVSDMTSDKSDLEIELKITNNRPPVSIEKDAPFVKDIIKLYEKLSYPVAFKGLYFYTDVSQIVPLHSVPFVILGPGEENMAHQRNERIELDSIDRMAKLYIEYILNL